MMAEYLEKKTSPSEDLTKLSTALRQLKETIPITMKDLGAYIECRHSVYFETPTYSIPDLRKKINGYFDQIESDCQSVDEDRKKKSVLPFQLNEFDVTHIDVGLGVVDQLCDVSGCTISPDGMLFVADHYGSGKLSVYDKEGKFLRFMPLSDKPYGVTVIDEKRIGVTYGQECYFEIIDYHTDTVEKKLSLEDAGCFLGIACCNERIYILAGDEGIVVTDLLGNIINKVELPGMGRIWSFIAVSSDRIFIANFHNHELRCLDMEGNLIWIGDSDVIDYSTGLSVDKNGDLFVVDCIHRLLVLVDKDGKSSETVLSFDRNDDPGALYYSKERNVMCVGITSGRVAIYKLV